MPRRIQLFVVLAFAMAALFVRLGFWQLSRLSQRRASKAVISARLALPEVPLASLTLDSISEMHRRVVFTGVPDTAHEFLWTGRSRNGSRGVYIVTPVVVAGDTAVLVNRGWVYAPDAATADLSRWRERRTTFTPPR